MMINSCVQRDRLSGESLVPLTDPSPHNTDEDAMDRKPQTPLLQKLEPNHERPCLEYRLASSQQTCKISWPSPAPQRDLVVPALLDRLTHSLRILLPIVLVKIRGLNVGRRPGVGIVQKTVM